MHGAVCTLPVHCPVGTQNRYQTLCVSLAAVWRHYDVGSSIEEDSKRYHQNFLFCNNNEITACIADLFSSFCEAVCAVAFFKVVQQQTIGKVGNSVICLWADNFCLQVWKKVIAVMKKGPVFFDSQCSLHPSFAAFITSATLLHLAIPVSRWRCRNLCQGRGKSTVQPFLPFPPLPSLSLCANQNVVIDANLAALHFPGEQVPLAPACERPCCQPRYIFRRT